jgi:hypothetical protein
LTSFLRTLKESKGDSYTEHIFFYWEGDFYMEKTKRRSGWMIIMLVLLTTPVMAQTNIALNRTYTLDPTGNYSGCTDAGDATQLTDGLYTQGYFWGELSTVGWHSGQNIIVTVDLASVQAISGVSFNTAGGAAGVNWPDHIHIFVAGSDQQFYEVGDLVALSNAENGPPPSSGYAVHKYLTNSLQTWGRYVAFMFDAWPYAFVDEVEVYSGNSSWINSTRIGYPTSDLRGYFISENKTYTLDQVPNYPACTDAGDTTQLTDGLHTQGYFWGELSTVGWQNRENIIVTIDLASVQSISGVSFSSAGAPSAGVSLPDHIHVFVAGSDQQFYEVGDLVSLSNTENGPPPSSGYALHTFSTHNLQTWGRYVAFMFDARSYAFVDEIEVFSGNPSWINSARTGYPTSDLRGYFISEGKSYTLDSAPNYPGCTDVGDATQLTDGAYTQGGYFWTQLSTVGWWHGGDNIIVKLDLASAKAISGISFNTAGGGADVFWPDHIHILVAGEDQVFYEIGDLVALSNTENGPPPASGYAIHKYSTQSLQTWGRYVALVFDSRIYAFCDEIGIFSGNPGWVGSPRTGTGNANIREYLYGKDITGGVKGRIQSDIDAIRIKAGGTSAQSYVEAELNAVVANIPNIEIPYSPNYKAILPLNMDHERVFKAQAYYWNALGWTGVRYWNSPLWGLLSHLADPPPSNGASVSMDMMKGEYRAGAFNLSNATQSPKSITMTITGLPGGTNPSYITVHDVTWTDTCNGQPVAAALPVLDPVNGSYPMTLQSGLTKQIWLTFHPTSISPGTYTGQIQLRGEVTIDIPVTLTLRNYSFPSVPTLGFGGFDYSDAFPSHLVNEGNKAAVLNHLKDHFVDSPWATRSVIPDGTYDSQGNLATNPSTAPFDSWIALWPDARKYYVFAGAGDYIGGSPYKFYRGTPEFNTAVMAWITFWKNHIQAIGLEPAQVALLLVDEPCDNVPAIDDTIIAWAGAIHNANTGIKVWEDPIYSARSTINESAMEACDILSPNRLTFLAGDQALRDYYVGRQALGTELQFYSCQGPVRSLDPYSYHRLQAWTCWKYQATAMHFWTFTRSGLRSSWNEYVRVAGDEFTPFFIDSTSVTPGKHMEACREGIEDYEYFVILKNLVSQAIANGFGLDPRTTTAQTRLNTLPGQVLDNAGTAYLWADTTPNRTLADTNRSLLLDSIMDLKSSLFYDGFESMDFATGAWINSGCGFSSFYKYAGLYSVMFNSSGSLTRSISTANYQNIQVSYARYTRLCETDDHFIAEWYNGTTWTTLENLTGNSSWTVRTFTLPSGANNNPNFKIRFRTSHNGSFDYAYLDEVRVSANSFADFSIVIIPGDANKDGSVDVGDLGILAANYGGSNKSWGQGDFNGDGLVDVGDLGILAAHYGEGSTQPSNFNVDYASAFGLVVEDDADETSPMACDVLGLPLLTGLFLAGLIFVKVEE